MCSKREAFINVVSCQDTPTKNTWFGWPFGALSPRGQLLVSTFSPFLCFEVQFVSTLAFLLRQLIYQLKCCLFPFYKGLYGGLELALIWIKLIREPKATPNYCPSWPEDKNQSCSGTTKTIGLASKGLLLRQVYTGNNRDRLRKYKPELWVTLKMDFTHSEKLAKSSIQPKICL